MDRAVHRSAATNTSLLQGEDASKPWQRDLQVQEFSLGPFERNLSIEKLSLRAKGKSPRLVSDRAVHRSAATNTSVLQREDASQPWMNSASGRGKETCRSRISFLGPWGRDLPIEDLFPRAVGNRPADRGSFSSGRGEETCRSRIFFLGPWGRDLPIEDLFPRAVGKRPADRGSLSWGRGE